MSGQVLSKQRRTNDGKGGRNISIEYMKLLCAFLVVAIHVSPLQSINETADFVFTRIIARIAVPFFFMVSGYFVLSDCKKHNGKALRFLKKTCILYLAATLLYLPVNIYAGNFKDISLGQVCRDVFFDGTFYHLWYLPAVMLGMVICLMLIRAIGEKAAFAISLVLYAVGLVGDSYYGLTKILPLLGKVYDEIFKISSYTRNGIFFAPAFLMLGCLAAKANERKREYSQLITGMEAVIFFLLMAGEGLVLHKLQWQRHDSMYVFLVPLMYFLFLWISRLSCGINSHKRERKNRNSIGAGRKDMGNGAMLIYIIHPFVLVALRGVSKPLGLYDILVENTLVCYLAVSLLSAFAAWILLAIYHLLGVGKKKKKSLLPDLQTDRAWIEIDLEHLKWNVEQIKASLPKGCKFMAVVKANAYGHGDVEVAKFLYGMGVKAFATATLEEAVHLRKNGLKGKILILGYTSPENAGYLAKYHLVQTVLDENYAGQLNEQGIPVKVHVKVDTGMHRLGEDWRNGDKILNIFQYPNLQIEGIFSHLCVSDSGEDEAVLYTRKQIRNFEQVLDKIETAGYTGLKTHLQSSYGTVNYPELQCSYVRMGIMMYGCLSSPDDEAKRELSLKPVLTLKARVALVRKLNKGECVGYGCTFRAPYDMMIAAVTIGYGDGYPRNLSEGKGWVLVGGKKAPIIGRICMDQLTVDLTGIEDVYPGDEVILIGEAGRAGISAEEVAAAAGTITNELLCRMGSRLGHIVAQNDRI